MSGSNKRHWRFRYSLKSLLLFWVFVGGGVVWVSHTYHEYLREQQFLADLVKATMPRALT